MAPGASGKRRGWCYSGGTGNVECTIPVIDDGKRIGKRGAAGVYKAPCKEWHYWTSKDGRKFFDKISTFLSPGCRSTRNRALSRYSGSAGRNDLSEGFWENGDVLLQEIGQSITFVREGCRRNLNGASGQTAL